MNNFQYKLYKSEPQNAMLLESSFFTKDKIVFSKEIIRSCLFIILISFQKIIKTSLP